jgi:hypothetical protein
VVGIVALLSIALGDFEGAAMNVGESVRKAIDDWQQGDVEAAMLHACNAIDGTASKTYPNLRNRNNLCFTTLLRDNYGVLGPMGVPGIDLKETRFPVRTRSPQASGGTPDIADVIYGVHRCTHGHGQELPDGFALLRDAAGPPGITHLRIEEGKVRLSDRVIFGLLAVAVFAPTNVGQAVPESYFLTFGTKQTKLPINEWWGRAADFQVLAAMEPLPLVRLDFDDWMPPPTPRR